MRSGSGILRGLWPSSRKARALVTGVTGQDGRHLVSDLTSAGIQVVGVSRSFQGYLDSNGVSIPVIALDYSDAESFSGLLDHVKPEIIFHLASNSSSTDKKVNANEHWLINVEVVSNILDWIKQHSGGTTRLVQALSSEIFRGSPSSPQSEATASRPTNPYGEAKARAREILAEARLEGLHASAAILYNHESPLRDPSFLSRRVTLGAARIALGFSEFLELRSLTDQRDWGHSADYTRAMLLMAQRETPSEYVVSSGELRAVKRLCEVSFAHLGLDLSKIRVASTENNEFQANNLVGDPTRALQDLGWVRDYSFERMVEEMTELDFRLLRDASGGFRRDKK